MAKLKLSGNYKFGVPGGVPMGIRGPTSLPRTLSSEGVEAQKNGGKKPTKHESAGVPKPPAMSAAVYKRDGTS